MFQFHSFNHERIKSCSFVSFAISIFYIDTCSWSNILSPFRPFSHPSPSTLLFSFLNHFHLTYNLDFIDHKNPNDSIQAINEHVQLLYFIRFSTSLLVIGHYRGAFKDLINLNSQEKMNKSLSIMNIVKLYLVRFMVINLERLIFLIPMTLIIHVVV